MCPLSDDIKILINQIVSIADRRIASAQPSTGDEAQVAADKLEIITTYTAYRNAALDFYTLT